MRILIMCLIGSFIWAEETVNVSVDRKRINEGDIQAGSKCAGFRLFNIWVASKSAKDGFYLEIEKKMIELNIAPDVFKALRSYSPY